MPETDGMTETHEDAALVEAMMTARHGSEDWRKNPSWIVELQRGTMAHVLAVVRSHDRAAARARLDALGAAYDAAPGVAETDSAALIEAMCETYDAATDDEAIDEAMARVLALVRAHDAPTIATLTASLAEAEARAGRAEAKVASLHERLEDNRVWQMDPANPDGPMIRVDVEPGSIPDGISCRDETIEMLDEHIKELRAELASGLRNAALHFRCPEGAEALHAALGITDDSEACGKLDAAFKAVARAERLSAPAKDAPDV